MNVQGCVKAFEPAVLNRQIAPVRDDGTRSGRSGISFLQESTITDLNRSSSQNDRRRASLITWRLVRVPRDDGQTFENQTHS